MRKWRLFTACLIFQTLLLAFIACDKDDGPSVNPNITQLTDMYSGHQFMADWNNFGIVGIDYPTTLYDPSNGLYDDDRLANDHCGNVRKSFTYTDDVFMSFVSVSDIHPVALLVESFSNLQSIGSLSLWNFETCELSFLRDTSFNISSAHFINKEDIIYYTFGNEVHTRAGYYWMKDTPENDSLIFPYLSDLGQYEVVNGFDVHPDGAKLILPLVGWDQTPLIAEYDMSSGQLDILNINLNVSNRRFNLWLRYNHDGENLLYGLYPPGAYVNVSGDVSEIGIIDMMTLQQIQLDTDIHPVSESYCIFPNWSPDGKSVIYGGGGWGYTGIVDRYSLYIHHNIQIP